MKKLLFLSFLLAILLVPRFALAQQVESVPKTNSSTNTVITTTANTQAAPKTKRISKRKPSLVKEELIELPSLADRLNDQRLAIRRGEQREPSQPYLIEEVSVNGIYKSVEGYGAFLKAVNGRLFFAYSGMLFYDGKVLQIDPDQVLFQQNIPNGKTKQLVKAYDPSALRSNSLDKDKKDTTKKKKAKTDDDSQDVGTKEE